MIDCGELDEAEEMLNGMIEDEQDLDFANGELEYVALTDGAQLCQFPQIDGFAHTWLDGEGEHEEENRVWFGADGAVENRGPSAEKVRIVLERLLDALNQA